MANPTQEIMGRLGRQRVVPRLRGTTATMRFDVIGAGSWLVAIDDGAVTVTESRAPADCVLELDEETLRRMVTGEQKPLIAFMQGLVTIQGEPAMALNIAGLFAPTVEAPVQA